MNVLDIPTARWFLPMVAPHRYKGAHGGRGSGKSHSFAELMIEENIAQKLDKIAAVSEIDHDRITAISARLGMPNSN